MTEDTTSADGWFPTGEQPATDTEDWPDEIREEFERNEYNGSVGSELLLENERVRVWEIRLEPGERLPVHRHVLDYFWVAVTPGHTLGRCHDGTTIEDRCHPGASEFTTVEAGEFLLHDLTNVGDTEMVFTTVELKESANEPLEI
jgi:hypothetical protein